MKNLSSAAVTVCCVCASVGILSALIPQKRTSKIMSFVIGLFMTVTLISAVSSADISLSDNGLSADVYEVPEYSEDDLNKAAVNLTAEQLTSELNELLLSEGIRAEDIGISLKITDEGRIYAQRVVIYISKAYVSRREEIKSIVYRNLSKEPEIYVKGQEAERDPQR